MECEYTGRRRNTFFYTHVPIAANVHVEKNKLLRFASEKREDKNKRFYKYDLVKRKKKVILSISWDVTKGGKLTTS